MTDREYENTIYERHYKPQWDNQSNGSGWEDGMTASAAGGAGGCAVILILAIVFITAFSVGPNDVCVR